MNDSQQFACRSLCIQPAHASSNTSLPLFHATPDMSSPHFPSVEPSDIHEDTAIYEDNHDVEMVSNLEPGPSQPSQTTPATPGAHEDAAIDNLLGAIRKRAKSETSMHCFREDAHQASAAVL